MQEIGSKHLVLIDGHGKRGDHQWSGLTDTMKRAVFDKSEAKEDVQVGDMCLVEVKDAYQNTLVCEPLGKMSVQDYFEKFGKDRKVPYRHTVSE